MKSLSGAFIVSAAVALLPRERTGDVKREFIQMSKGTPCHISLTLVFLFFGEKRKPLAVISLLFNMLLCYCQCSQKQPKRI